MNFSFTLESSWSILEWIGSFFSGKSEEKSKTGRKISTLSSEEVDDLRNEKYKDKY